MFFYHFTSFKVCISTERVLSMMRPKLYAFTGGATDGRLTLEDMLSPDKSRMILVTVPPVCPDPARADVKIAGPNGLVMKFDVIDKVLQNIESSFTIGNFRSKLELNITIVLLCASFRRADLMLTEYVFQQIHVVSGVHHCDVFLTANSAIDGMKENQQVTSNGNTLLQMLICRQYHSRKLF